VDSGQNHILHCLAVGIVSDIKGKIELRRKIFKRRSQWPCGLRRRSAAARLLRLYRGAGKSLARPGRKQATATEDFDVHISYLLS
jgi:hypothetical protein